MRPSQAISFITAKVWWRQFPGGLARHLSETLWPIMILGINDAEA